jgi:hypothetical protein
MATLLWIILATPSVRIFFLAFGCIIVSLFVVFKDEGALFLLFGMSRRWMTNLYNDFLDLAMASI